MKTLFTLKSAIVGLVAVIFYRSLQWLAANNVARTDISTSSRSIFCRNVEWFLPGRSPVLYGGDFNIDRFREDQTGSDSDLYNLIVDAGFRDAYAVPQTDSLDELCNDADEHCTFGVTELSKIDDPKRRIDYVFDIGFGTVAEARVVFNPTAPSGTGPTASDHAGVFVRLALSGS